MGTRGIACVGSHGNSNPNNTITILRDLPWVVPWKLPPVGHPVVGAFRWTPCGYHGNPREPKGAPPREPVHIYIYILSNGGNRRANPPISQITPTPILYSEWIIYVYLFQHRIIDSARAREREKENREKERENIVTSSSLCECPMGRKRRSSLVKTTCIIPPGHSLNQKSVGVWYL